MLVYCEVGLDDHAPGLDGDGGVAGVQGGHAEDHEGGPRPQAELPKRHLHKGEQHGPSNATHHDAAAAGFIV